MKIVLLDEKCEPIKATPGASAYDLYTRESGVVKPGEAVKFLVGIKLKIPENVMGVISSRGSSSLDGLFITGDIDPDYTGEFGIIVHNIGLKPFTIEKYKRYAQIKFVKTEDINLEYVNELPPTKRGERGFGHTGRD